MVGGSKLKQRPFYLQSVISTVDNCLIGSGLGRGGGWEEVNKGRFEDPDEKRGVRKGDRVARIFSLASERGFGLWRYNSCWISPRRLERKQFGRLALERPRVFMEMVLNSAKKAVIEEVYLSLYK